MKVERRIEKFLKRIDVIPDVERKRMKLECLLAARDQSQTITSADIKPTIRSIFMNRQIWKIAASLAFLVTVIGVVVILQNGNQAAYAWEQTVAAMEGKCSFHIMTYYGSPTKRKDEYWVEFDEQGRVIRCRQVEWWARGDHPVEVLWTDQVKRQYEPDDEGGPGILLISNKKHHVDEEALEEFDPEMMAKGFKQEIENRGVSVVIDESHRRDGKIIFEMIREDKLWRRIVVDADTKIVKRMDEYRLDERDAEGNQAYLRGIEVLEYNQPLDPALFEPNFPADTIVVDQLSRAVGMAQGDLSQTEVAVELVRQALEAWAADDYETAGLLFGGAPKEYFMQHMYKKPMGQISVGEPEWMPLEPDRPRYRVICHYTVGDDEEQESFMVTTVAGQPDRWFITPIKL